MTTVTTVCNTVSGCYKLIDVLMHISHSCTDYSAASSHLFKSNAEQFEVGRLSHGKTQTVDGVQNCTQEAT